MHRLSVEFLGLPGSGKSTLSHRLAVHLMERGHAVDETSFRLAHGPGRPVRVARKAILVGVEILGHPLYALRSIAAIGSTRQPGVSVRLKMTVNWLLVSALLRRPRGGARIALHDQGLFQALWSIGLEAGPGAVEATLARLGRWMPAASLIVLLEASPRTIRDRLEERPERDSRLDRSGDGTDERLRRSAELIRPLRQRLEALQGEGEPAFVILDGGPGRLDGNVRELGAMIERMMGET